jgi:A/G-specific adenine glycosylase
MHDSSKIIPILQRQLLDWYETNKRDLPWRRTGDPYAVWVSEVMLQQTQVATVIPYYERFLIEFPDVHHLAAADLQKVLKAWEGLGYYARARNLHRSAGIVCGTHGGSIPGDWKAFRALPGVGDYIASAVLSIAFGQPYAVVDGNVKRVLARLLRIEAPVNATRYHAEFKSAADRLLHKSAAGDFNQALMELGALVCTPRQPVCHHCPLEDHCLVRSKNQQAEYPRRLSRRPVPQYRIAIGVILKKGRLLITQRKTDGLLGGLWEFPGGKIQKGESPEAAVIREIGEEVNLKVRGVEKLARVKHAYTHFKVDMDVFICRYESGRVKLAGPADFRWVTLAAIERFPLPKANHKFLPALKETLARQGF